MWPFKTHKTQPEQFLELLTGRDWVSTDEFLKHGIKDYKSAKFSLKKQGYLFDRRNECPHGKAPAGSHYKTYYKLVGRLPGAGSMTEKRGYLKDFSEHELITELWRRGRLEHAMLKDEMYTILN